MARVYSSRITHPVGGSPSAGGGLWYDLPIQAFNQRDCGVYFNDFTGPGDYDVIINADWAENLVGAPAGNSTTVSGVNSFTPDMYGNLSLVVGSAASTGYNIIAASGTGSYPRTGRVVVAEWRVVINTANQAGTWAQSNWFFGLADTASTTTPMASTGVLGAANLGLVGYSHLASVGNGIPVLTAAGDNGTVINPTPTRPILTGVINVFRSFGIRIEDSNRVFFYLDGILVGGTVLASGYASTSSLRPCISVVNHSAATNTNFKMDYISIASSR